MESKKFKIFKFYENNGGEETNKSNHICNFKSCAIVKEGLYEHLKKKIQYL